MASATPAMTDPAEAPWLTLPALRAAWKVVKDNKGVAGGDGVSIARFRLQLDANLLALQDEVRTGTYVPGPARRTRLRMGNKWREITVLPVRDRVLQRAVLDYLEVLPPFVLPDRNRRQVVEQATQPPHQHDLAGWAVGALLPAPEPPQRAYLAPLQRHPPRS
mgnify:CR=1 FL=1